MKRLTEEWTIVLAGAWNTRIFSPKFVSEELLPGEEVAVEIPFASTGLTPLRFVGQKLVIITRSDRLVIGVREAGLESMKMAESLARRAVALLPKTPFSACGVNFSWLSEDPKVAEVKILDLGDGSAIKRCGGTVERLEILRNLNTSRGVCNFRIVYDGVSKLRYAFNFHADATNDKKVIEFLTDRVGSDLQFATGMLKEVYGVEEEEEAHAAN